jgi:hypothetical protein
MDRLMSNIIRQKQLPQEEHQALQRIGKEICSRGLDRTIKLLFSSFWRVTEEHLNVSETEILGRQFLEAIELYSSVSSAQEHAHMFLVLLHEIALNIQ